VLHQLIEQRLQQAVAALVPDADLSAVLVRPCPDPRFGDYQSSALISLARARKTNPRQLAEDVLTKLDVSEWCEKPEIAGAGFINFRLKTPALAQAVQSAARAEHPFVPKAKRSRTIVIDFSSPNVAKPMHVGHIRSTILGDSLARTLRLLGHRVITDNHIGDWGTQFGMLLVGWKTLLDRKSLEADPLSEMERIYKAISSRCDPEKPGFDQATLDRARGELVKLQVGDGENLGIWKEMIRLSQAQFDVIYARLGVKFDHTLGESFYNPRLKAVVEELRAKGIARESEGAICVFSDGSLPPKDDPFLKHEDGEWKPNPCLIQKSDGGFNYATTDLATLAYRLETWTPDEITYVTDGRQQLHFRQLFAVFRRWHPEVKVKLAHVWFGSILGEDGRPFRTRSGETVKLADLLDEAEERAFKIVSEKNPELSESERREIARVVGISAVKYADLLPNRQSDYVFSWDKLLALEGNTAPYLLYAYTRTRSLARKAREIGVTASNDSILSISAPEEIALAKQLLNFALALEAVSEECRPNFLCNYLYDLAGLLSRFWEECPVLKSTEPERTSRLLLTNLTGLVLKQGLDVLGIETTEQM
jgi:arginyl-tRNA synthetase